MWSAISSRPLAGLVLAAALGLPAPAGGTAGPAVSLTISASDGDGHRSGARVTCRGGATRATGFLHGRAASACREARRSAAFLGSPPPVDRPCTEIYGGPDTGWIRGTIGRRTIDRRFSRVDGCAIADWGKAGLLLPASRFTG